MVGGNYCTVIIVLETIGVDGVVIRVSGFPSSAFGLAADALFIISNYYIGILAINNLSIIITALV